MARIEVPFANQEGKSSIEQNSQETLVNMFAEVESSGASRLVRRQRAGLERLASINGEKRCIERFGNYHYAVINATFYRYDGTTLSGLATLGTGAGRCTMIDNDNGQIMISDGSSAYVWNGSSLSTVTLPSGVTCGSLAYIGGFGVFNSVGTGQFYVTGLNDFTSVNALDFATAESSPDPLVRVFIDHNEVWLFGTRSIEIWQLSGSADFPFARFTNAQMERGCGAAMSVAADDNTVFWLGDDFVVYRADGYRPVRVSSHAVERAIAGLSRDTKTAASAFFYTMGGNKFYTLTFPEQLTVQYNIATGFWSRASTFGRSDWRIMGSAGKATDYYMTPGGIVRLQPGLSTDEGGVLERSGISAPIYAGGNRVSLRSFFLDAEMGRAEIGQAADIMLRVAPDGVTFGNERWRSLGETGQYARRATWRNCGQGRRMAVEFSMTDPTELAIVGAGADIQVASS